MYSSENEEFAMTREITVQINKTNPPAFSLSKKDLNNLVVFTYTNCFNAISNEVALIFFLSEFKSCALSMAFLIVSEMS